MTVPTTAAEAFARAAPLFAVASQQLGIRPAPGSAWNPVIAGWWDNLGWRPQNDESISPCSVALSAWATAVGGASAQSPYPDAWVQIGVAMTDPLPGCVAVKKGTNTHVGIVFGVRPYGLTAGPEVCLLGAGQDWPGVDGVNQVTISGWAKVTDYKSFRWIMP